MILVTFCPSFQFVIESCSLGVDRACVAQPLVKDSMQLKMAISSNFFNMGSDAMPHKKKKHAYALEDSYYHDYTRNNLLNLLWYNVYHVNKHRIQCINRLKIWNLKNPHTSQKFIILIINITQIYDFLNLVWCWC